MWLFARRRDSPKGARLKTRKATTHQGYYWVYHNSKEKLVLFDYRPGRDRDGPNDILKDFQGYLQTDGYAGYEDFDKRSGIIHMHCVAPPNVH